MGYRFCQKEKKYVHTDVITERKEKAIKLVKEKKVKVKEDNSFAMVQDDILNPLRAANKKLKQFGEILEKEPIRDGHCYNLYRDGKFVKSFYNYMEALRYAGIEFHGRRIDNYAKF
jgi:hypothetical protein